MNNNLAFYSSNADALVAQYDSASFESVHKDWLNYIPNNGAVLDIGAGSGRDARYLAKRGLQVYAAEPVLRLMLKAKENSARYDITWYQDALPSLAATKAFTKRFDLILLSAVWMHLTCEERTLAMHNIAPLLNSGGSLVITLRHGEFDDGRTSYPLSVSEVSDLAHSVGLSVILKTKLAEDQLGRTKVNWQAVVLRK